MTVNVRASFESKSYQRDGAYVVGADLLHGQVEGETEWEGIFAEPAFVSIA